MRQKTFGAFLFLFYVFCIDRGKRGARLRFTKEGAEVINFCFFKLAFAFLFFSGGTALRFILWFALFLWSGFAALRFFVYIHSILFLILGNLAHIKKQARIFKAGPVFI